MREALLDFIADFANWDNSTVPAYLETSRALTQAAHEALGGVPGSRPLVVDPFAEGGSIPLEALRIGADAFASDLNPVPVLLNKIVLEYISKYGRRLADEVRRWGRWVKERAEKELAAFYPQDPDGATPIAYLWARTVLSEAPGHGKVPVEVPLMRSLWLAKKASRRRALRWVRDAKGQVQTETVEVTYVEDGQPVVREVRRPLLEIFEPKRESEVKNGTVDRGSATCPVTGYTMKVDRVRAQLKSRRGGAADARLFCVVTTRNNEQGRFYRLPTQADQAAFAAAAGELERREEADGTSRARKGRRDGEGSELGQGSRRSLVPDEVISLNELRRISVPIYGMERWCDLFSPRQALALTTLARLVREAGEQMAASADGEVAEAVQTCLGLAIGRQADAGSSLCRWHLTGEKHAATFGRQALGMVWDFSEVATLSEMTGGFSGALAWVEKVLSANTLANMLSGHVEQASATNHPLPNDSADAFVTDPPYYDAVPYAYLSDFFYVWIRRTLADVHPALFREAGVPKDAEIVVDRPHQLSRSTKNIAFYERELTKAFAQGRRITQPGGVGTIVFASKTTASWEAILQAVVDAGWVMTGSWPIDTEMETRVAAQGQARLASSVHLVCRPRANAEGRRQKAEVEDDEGSGKFRLPPSAFSLEYDAARKIAQGLGAHLETLTSVVEVRGETARLLPVTERTKALFGRDEGDAPVGRKKKPKQMRLTFDEELQEAEAAGGWGAKGAPKLGETTLDRVHQTMILFAAGRSEAMRRFLVEEGVGRDGRFWTLAQALSALYPAGSDEKRWVDGVLARKKGLGF